MSWLRVDAASGGTEFRPGESFSGTASWSLDAPAKHVDIRLFWYTEGRGTQDVAVVDSLRVEAPQASDRRDFLFTLPAQPYSFSGRLISLHWAVEVVAEPSGEAQRFGFTLSPTGRTVLLGDPEGDGGGEGPPEPGRGVWGRS